MKLQTVILSALAFIVVLFVGIYVLHAIAAYLFPGGDTMVVYGLPEIVGLILAIAAAAAGWVWSSRPAAVEE